MLKMWAKLHGLSTVDPSRQPTCRGLVFLSLTGSLSRITKSVWKCPYSAIGFVLVENRTNTTVVYGINTSDKTKTLIETKVEWEELVNDEQVQDFFYISVVGIVDDDFFRRLVVENYQHPIESAIVPGADFVPNLLGDDVGSPVAVLATHLGITSTKAFAIDKITAHEMSFSGNIEDFIETIFLSFVPKTFSYSTVGASIAVLEKIIDIAPTRCRYVLSRQVDLDLSLACQIVKMVIDLISCRKIEPVVCQQSWINYCCQ